MNKYYLIGFIIILIGTLSFLYSKKQYTDEQLTDLTKHGVVLSCDHYHYSTCPDICEKICVATNDPARAPGTADCDGPISCKKK